jgi:hypothetical protein
VVLQELSDRDIANRITVANHLIGILFHDVIILMVDEVHFHLSGCVNKQNYRYWLQENLLQLHQRPHHSGCVTLFCRVIGPYSSEDEDDLAVTVTSARYVEMLRNLLTRELSCGNELSTIWFQQDGATAHTARAFMDVAREVFAEHVISLLGEFSWPARSPDLLACDYFL